MQGAPPLSYPASLVGGIVNSNNWEFWERQRILLAYSGMRRSRHCVFKIGPALSGNGLRLPSFQVRMKSGCPDGQPDVSEPIPCTTSIK